MTGDLSVTENGQAFHGVNPTSGEKLEPAYVGISAEDVAAIAEQAAAAALEYRDRSAKDRATLLRTIASNIEEVVEDLVERMSAETALPEPRVRGEAGRTMGQLRMFADLIEEGSWVDARIDTADPDRQPIPKPDVRSMLQASGPVVVFCASNFPLAFSVAGGDTASALAAGCPVIVKAHHSHPGTAEIVGQAVIKAVASCGMPSGTFALVYGSGREIGTALVKQAEVKAVGFTGSRAGGTALVKVARERPKPIPVFAEMSSINPMLILPGALAASGERIAKELAGSVTLGMGQFCTNPGLVLLPAGEAANQFAATLKDGLSAASGCLLNAGIATAYREALKARSDLSGDGIEILHSAPGDGADGACKVGSALYQVTAKAFAANPVLAEEAFGPATTLVTYENDDELLQLLQAQEGQLTGTIHGTDEDLAQASTAIAALQERVGRLIFGGFPTGVEVCHAMVHGGPFPATSDGRSTSVGTMAIHRFVRTVSYQSAPQPLLPDELKDNNPSGIQRLVNGQRTTDSIS